ncbi:regulator [Mycoavidus sp. B2-EB]|uniref:regulator n=1 Tax=Mycoavidus sp. B2-EB TaxID=2651972 RepID=UPI00162AE334|nr:regulator [Mycoavidus sp. B2-EB]
MQSPELHLLLPFSLPAQRAADYTLPALEQGALAKFLARATLTEKSVGTDFQRTLPHERWLARRFNVIESTAIDEAPLAPYMLLADQAQAQAETAAHAAMDSRLNPIAQPDETTVWACVEPVHLQLAHDHLILIDPTHLMLAADEAAALLKTAQPLMTSLGITLVAPTPLRWYLSAPSLQGISGASPLRAAGRNIEIWLPRETRTDMPSRTWLKVQNEVQMAWFEDPINHARETRGAYTANSIWLYAQGSERPVTRPFTCILAKTPAARGLALAAGLDAPHQIGFPPAHFNLLAPFTTAPTTHAGAAKILVELDALSAPFLQQDWPGWAATLSALEQNWFAPALAALQNGALRTLTVTLCGEVSSITLTATRADLRKFWRRRSTASLLEA